MAFRLHAAAQCCPISDIMTPATKIAQPCVCEDLCRANASCAAFSHTPFPFGNCEFCSTLFNCTKRELKGQRTWERLPEGVGAPRAETALEEAVRAREAAPKCPKTRFVVQNT
eukprot:2980773-Prymnesium_polylepis.1